MNALKKGDKPEVAVVVAQVLTPQLGIDKPNSEEMALIDNAKSEWTRKGGAIALLIWLLSELPLIASNKNSGVYLRIHPNLI